MQTVERRHWQVLPHIQGTHGRDCECDSVSLICVFCWTTICFPGFYECLKTLNVLEFNVDKMKALDLKSY